MPREPTMYDHLPKTTKKTITEQDRLALVGAFAIAAKYLKMIDSLTKVAAGITGEKGDGGYYGHTSDAISGNMTVDELLEKLGIEVVDG